MTGKGRTLLPAARYFGGSGGDDPRSKAREGLFSKQGVCLLKQPALVRNPFVLTIGFVSPASFVRAGSA